MVLLASEPVESYWRLLVKSYTDGPTVTVAPSPNTQAGIGEVVTVGEAQVRAYAVEEGEA